MKMAVIFSLLALLAAVFAQSTQSAASRCISGRAHAFIAIRQDPPYLVGTIPAQFTRDARYFQRRYNCLHGSAEVRRRDEGVYDVRFPLLSVRAVIATALSDEGVSTSALPLRDSIVRVVLRGPLDGEVLPSRRDVPFTVVVY